jgi:beta-lactamase regulating signal transducer with metallopeptidase domain
MWVGLDHLSRILVDATLAAVIFLSLVVLVMLLCQQPARRVVLAQAAILIAALVIPLVAANPLRRWSARSWLTHPELFGQAHPAEAGEGSHPPEQAIPSGPMTDGTITPASEGESWSTQPWPLRIVSLAYLAGATIGLVWFLIGFWGVGRLIRHSDDPSPATGEFYRELVRQVEGRVPAPRLRVSPRVRQPVVAGLLRSYILIPPEFDDEGFDRESLRIILVHELAHADQSDSQFGAAASLAQTLWFFLPYLWWLRAQMRTDQEFLADQKTALLAGSPVGYATRLVSLAAPQKDTSSFRPILDSVPLLSGWWRGGGLRTRLLQRVVMLLHCPFPIELEAPRWWSFSVPILVLGLAILCSVGSVGLMGGRMLFAPPSESSKSHTNRFQVARFVAPPHVTGQNGRSSAHVLPLPLPERWQLSLEIQATQAALRRIRLVGLPLELPEGPAHAGQGRSDRRDSPASTFWHRVRLDRDGDQIRLEIDGKAIAVDRAHSDLADWLTIEPAPDETAVLRNVTVTW